MPDTVNSQITDPVTPVSSRVSGDAPATAVGDLFAATGQALANAVRNATNNQQQGYVVAQAAMTQTIAIMLSIDTAATAKIANNAPGEDQAPMAAVAAQKAILASPLEARTLADATFEAVRASADPMLTLMVLDAGALALLDAVAHLQRVSVVAETASALALTRALAEPNGDIWKEVMAAADQSIAQATGHLETVAKFAIETTRAARG